MSAGIDHARGELRGADARRPPGPAGADPGDAAHARDEQADVVFARRIGRDESRDQAHARDRLLRDDGAPRARALPGPGRRLPADVAARRGRGREMPERRRFLRGMVAWVGFKQVPIEYRRAGPHGRRRRLLPRAVPAGARGDHLVLRRAAATRHLPRASLTAASARWRRSSLLVLTLTGALAASDELWILVAVLFLGGVAADQHRDPRALPGARPRAGAARPLYLVARTVSRHAEDAPEGSSVPSEWSAVRDP